MNYDGVHYLREPKPLYGLAGADGVIRYVGWARKPALRLVGHVSAARRGDARPVYGWIRECLARSEAINVVILRKRANGFAERREIWRRTSKGEPLLNIRDNAVIERRACQLIRDARERHDVEIRIRRAVRKALRDLAIEGVR